MQYQNLRIRDIVNKTPRHRLRSCFWSNTKTPAHIMLSRAVWHTVAARHRTKTITSSVESSLRPSSVALAPRRLRQWRGWQRWRGQGRRWEGGVRAGATWMCAPLLYPVGISIFFDLSLRFEFYFLCACSPDHAEAPGEFLFHKFKFQYFMHPESISVIYNWY